MVKKRHLYVLKISFVLVKQQRLRPVAHLLPACENEVAWLPSLNESAPPQTPRQCSALFLALNFVRLETDTPFQVFYFFIFCPVVGLDLFIIGILSQPVVWHDARDWRSPALVAAADHLDPPTFKPVKKRLEDVPGHRTDFVPNYNSRNELLPHPFRCPVVFTTPPKETVICSGLG